MEDTLTLMQQQQIEVCSAMSKNGQSACRQTAAGIATMKAMLASMTDGAVPASKTQVKDTLKLMQQQTAEVCNAMGENTGACRHTDARMATMKAMLASTATDALPAAPIGMVDKLLPEECGCSEDGWVAGSVIMGMGKDAEDVDVFRVEVRTSSPPRVYDPFVAWTALCRMICMG